MATYGRIRSARLLVIALLLTSLVTITVDARGGRAGPLAAIGRVGITIITPLQKGVSAIVQPIGGFFSNMFRGGSLAEENDVLRSQLAEIGAKLAAIPALEAEIARLAALLDLREEVGLSETLGARVIALSPSNLEWYVEVGVGSSDGVVEDMPVIAHNALVGVVHDVLPSSSIVQLLIDTEFAAAARLETTRETGVLSGHGEDELELHLFDPEARVRPGDRVITAGYRLPNGDVGTYPPGIGIGEVVEVQKNASTGGPTVLVRPYVDFSRLEEVLLVFPPAATPPQTPPDGS